MITLANFKIYLKITDSTQDDQLNLAISNANGFLEAYLGYDLTLDAAKVAFFSSQYKKSFELCNTNINSVSQIRYASDEFDPDWIAYNTTTNFKVYLERGLVNTRDSIWPYTEITYSFWYDDSTCPNDLQSILYDIAAMSFKSMWEISMWDLKSENVDGDSITFKDITWSLSTNSLILLDKYKQYGFSA